MRTPVHLEGIYKLFARLANHSDASRRNYTVRVHLNAINNLPLIVSCDQLADAFRNFECVLGGNHTIWRRDSRSWRSTDEERRALDLVKRIVKSQRNPLMSSGISHVDRRTPPHKQGLSWRNRHNLEPTPWKRLRVVLSGLYYLLVQCTFRKGCHAVQ